MEKVSECFLPYSFLLEKPVLFTTFIAGLLALIILRRKVQLSGTPPGTFGWPILGETLQFFSAGKRGATEEFYKQRSQKYGPVFTTSLLGKPMVVFYGPEGNRSVFSNENKFLVMSWPDSVKKLLVNALVNKTGDEAKRLKKALMIFLRPEALRNHLGKIDAIVKSHISKFWFGKDQVKVYPLAKRFTFSLACSLFASIDSDEEQEELSKHYFDLVRAFLQLPIDLPGSRFRKGKRAREAILEKFKALFTERREALLKGEISSSYDLLSVLLTYRDEDENGLSDGEIKDNILTLLFAGHDTTNSGITFLIKLLAENPKWSELVFKEQTEIASSKKEGEALTWDDLQRMKHTWRVAQEALRLYPPVQGGFREVIKEFTYQGFRIPQGWKVAWTPYGTHLREEYFKDARRFNPERFEKDAPSPYTFVPFGGGPRACPGMEFARLEILVFLSYLVRHFRWELLEPSERITDDPLPTPCSGLPVKLIPRE
eukprot:TRINITY_DN20_c0_g2_i1.p1 TRINITY_DN20_c0_g2~~TRINITY_DN20_c0_g2_i1.p1  ORF type:complete len:486 (-),score=47.66 TRINITY_DN20_c0_g2_i1:106-1563(-)